MLTSGKNRWDLLISIYCSFTKLFIWFCFATPIDYLGWLFFPCFHRPLLCFGKNFNETSTQIRSNNILMMIIGWCGLAGSRLYFEKVCENSTECRKGYSLLRLRRKRLASAQRCTGTLSYFSYTMVCFTSDTNMWVRAIWPEACA